MLTFLLCKPQHSRQYMLHMTLFLLFIIVMLQPQRGRGGVGVLTGLCCKVLYMLCLCRHLKNNEPLHSIRLPSLQTQDQLQIHRHEQKDMRNKGMQGGWNISESTKIRCTRMSVDEMMEIRRRRKNLVLPFRGRGFL